MELFFAPLACSMSSRIALYEAGAEARFVQVDMRSKRILEGGDFLPVTPMGQVPVLRLADGTLLTENAAILEWIAELHPEAKLAPRAPAARAQMRRWLSFTAAELHASVFMPLLDPAAPEGAKEHARARLPRRMTTLASHLAPREHLLDSGFSVADAYLTVVLNWTRATATDLGQWPPVAAYFSRMRRRPSIARAMAEEAALYAEQQARNAA